MDPNIDGCEIDNSNISEGSRIESRVSASNVANYSSVLGKSEVKSGSSIDNSRVDGEAIVSNSTVSNQSEIYQNAEVRGSSFINSKAFGEAIVTSDKNNNICDGVDDDKPDDFCIMSVQE